jgi:hypothetical protein
MQNLIIIFSTFLRKFANFIFQEQKFMKFNSTKSNLNIFLSQNSLGGFLMIKDTQAWNILGLRFWILYFFVVTYA